MDELKKVIDLEPLSDESIKQHKYALADLWMVRDENQQIFGPYPTDSLREYSHRHQYLFENLNVYNLETETWHPIFEVKYFQRRKPQLMSSQNLITDSQFHILINGQKNGPFTTQKVKQLLDTGRIMPSTQVSLDDGDSWIKLYEHHAFDRRGQKKNEDLPFSPDQAILNDVDTTPIPFDDDALSELAQLNTAKEERTQTAITRTLIRNGIQTKTQIIKNPLLDNEMEQVSNEFSTENPHIQSERDKSKLSVVMVSLGLLFSLTFAGYYFYNNYSFEKPNRRVKTAAESIDNSARNNLTKPARRPASIKGSRYRNKPKANRAPPKIKPKRYVQKPRRVMPREMDPIEPLDINDPEVQEELTRKLAGDFPTEETQEADIYDSVESFDDEYPEEDDEYVDEPQDEQYFDEQVQEEFDYDSPYNE